MLNWQVGNTSGTIYLLIVRRLLVASSPNVCGDASARVIFVWISGVSRGTVVVELGRISPVDAAKFYFFRTLPTYKASSLPMS